MLPKPELLILPLCLLSLAGAEPAAAEPWCAAGLALPELEEDNGHPSISVILAQAPLFSNSPKFKQRLGLLGLFHSALVFRQDLGLAPRNWTLEFDSTTNVLGATLPIINGSKLLWENDARYCLTEGFLWGRKHWSKTFEVVMKISKAQMLDLFGKFLQPLNGTAHGTKPLYQLWNVAANGERSSESLISDLTCGDGVKWALHYISTSLGVAPRRGFRLRYTRINVSAHAVEPANTSDPVEWSRIVEYFRGMSLVVGRGAPLIERLVEFLSLMPVAFIFDSNSATYYRLHGNNFLWIRPTFVEVPLAGPPWMNTMQTRWQPVSGAEVEPTVGLIV